MAGASSLRSLEKSALSVIGGSLPLTAQEFANRAYRYHLNPLRNPVKEVLDAFEGRVADIPPMLGMFNDIPWHKLREDEVQSWAKAGFSWIVNDGEHTQSDGRYGREQNAMLARAGILPVQRLHRESVSGHGDAFQLGARATMRPYGTTLEEAEVYFKAVNFPTPGAATPYDRGGYPVRDGARNLFFTPTALRGAETETQGWIQFETTEYIAGDVRDAVLDVMAAQGPGRAAGFIGPFDAIMRGGDNPQMEQGITALIKAAAARNICMGRVVGSGSMKDPAAIEDAMVAAIQNGARFISVHYLASDLPYFGAKEVATPFFNACKRAGF